MAVLELELTQNIQVECASCGTALDAELRSKKKGGGNYS